MAIFHYFEREMVNIEKREWKRKELKELSLRSSIRTGVKDDSYTHAHKSPSGTDTESVRDGLKVCK